VVLQHQHEYVLDIRFGIHFVSSQVKNSLWLKPITNGQVSDTESTRTIGRVEFAFWGRQSPFEASDALRQSSTAQEALEIYRHVLEVKARDKSDSYARNNRYKCGVIQEFVDKFGPTRPIRECTQTHLLEFYQTLCFRPSLEKNSAGTLIGSIKGMIKAAQETKPDLANWQRPKLKTSTDSKYERRVVEPWEYATLVRILLDPPFIPSPRRRVQRQSSWRDAADAVQLLRMCGGRLNEVLRMKLDQFMWQKGKFILHATKTENKRDIPLWNPIKDVVQRRIHEGLTDGEYLFARAAKSPKSFDTIISHACLQAGEAAKLDYGRANGFTCHSLRHTFITDMMKATDRDIKLVMSWSGRRSLESFKIYLHPTEEGRILGAQHTDSVADFLPTFTGQEGEAAQAGVISEFVKPLKQQQVTA
jgi:integrase